MELNSNRDFNPYIASGDGNLVVGKINWGGCNMNAEKGGHVAIKKFQC